MESTITPQITLLDIKNVLYMHFLARSTFSVQDDEGLLGLGKAYDEKDGKMAQYKGALIKQALDDMVKGGFLLELDKVKGVYMLTQPLGTFNQSVVISPYTANLVADAFNFFARQTGPSPYVANKLAITDTEVMAIAQLVFAFRDELDEIYEGMDDGDEAGDELPPFGSPGMN